MKSHQIEFEVVRWREILYDRFGSLAAIKADISLMTAFGGKAAD